MDRKKIKEALENMKVGQVDEYDNEKSLSFMGSSLMLHFWKDDKVATVNFSLSLYPDESSNLTVKICKLLSDQTDRMLKIGENYVIDQNNNDFLFGEEAINFIEEENQNFVNERVDKIKQMDYLLENGRGFEC